MKITKMMAAAAIVTSAALTATAQDDGFDLTSQRGEVQEFNAVPGHKVDHGGLVINPTPQSITRTGDGVLNISKGFAVKDKQKKFAGDLGFLNISAKGLPLTIDFGEKAAKKAGVKAVDGAYVLEIDKKGIKITGYNERGAFYALQTLRQIIGSELAKKEGGLPLMVVNDYPSMKYRGVVEGFYGTPWSHDVRMSLIDFYGQNKMNDYLYGPKDDPYHSTPNWRLPYPADKAREIRELVDNARRNRVNFIWAIHPGQDIRWNKEDYDSLVNKFNMMYDLGVRSFAIFFDDIDGEGTNPHKQVELLNNLTRDFVKAKGDVTNLIVCPTDYSQLWAKPGPEGPLAVYGRELNPNVEVFWTGAVVCSDLTPETLEFVDSRIQRPALYWWNYPVTDYCKHILLQGPVYGLDTALTDSQVAGIESNPMEHGEASKLALYGVADYAWNTPAYNPIDNWERGLAALAPDAAEAYRTFAIHSADTETGYRRDESWETTIFPFDNYTPQQFEALRNEFGKIVKVEQTMREKANPALIKEIGPWLIEFTALGHRGARTLDLIKVYESGNDSLFWEGYSANLMSPDQRAAYDAHKIGTMKLQPFYENAMDGMATAFFQRQTGNKPAMYHGVGSYPNLRTTQAKLMLDGDTATYYTSANSQGNGDWIGLDLLEAKPVSDIAIRQGRNSVDDCDYYESAVLESSVDGRNWIKLRDIEPGTYIINWHEDVPVMARYVRLRRLDSNRTNWASVRTFDINPINHTTLGLNVVSADPFASLKAFDTNTTSFYPLVGDIAFDRRKNADVLVILSSSPATPFTVMQYDAKGREISRRKVDSAYSDIKLLPSATRIVINGRTDIYELIQR